MKYIREFRERFSTKELFSIRDVKLFLAEKGAPATYTSVFLSHLLKRNEIVRLTKGKYSFSRTIDFIEKAIFPSYHGLQDALSLHGLWGQQTIPIIITPRKIRSGERVLGGAKVIVRRISRKMFFGHESIAHLGSWTEVSDFEKTLIDFVYYNEPLDKEVLGKLKKRLDREKLRQYLKASPFLRKKMLKRFGIRV